MSPFQAVLKTRHKIRPRSASAALRVSLRLPEGPSRLPIAFFSILLSTLPIPTGADNPLLSWYEGETAETLPFHMVSLQSVAEVGQHVKFLCAAIDGAQVSFVWDMNAVSTGFVHHTEHRAFAISRQEDHQIQMSLLYLKSSVPFNGTLRCSAEDEKGKEQYMSKALPFFIMRGVSAATCDQVEVCDNETSSCREKPGGGVECVCRLGYTRDEHYTGFCLETRDVDEQCFIDLQCKAARTHSGCRKGLCRCIQPYLHRGDRCLRSDLYITHDK